ncbi:MAG: cupin domain-containing protein [Terricaulis sp.]
MVRSFGLALALVLSAACASAQEAPTAFAQAVATPPPAVAPPAAPGNPPTVFARSEMVFAPTDVGSRVSLIDEATRTLGQLEIHITTLNPGMASHAPHQHPNEEVIVLQQGELEVYVNGETKRISAGSMMVFLSNDWHSVNNVGSEPAIYEVINFHPR